MTINKTIFAASAATALIAIAIFANMHVAGNQAFAQQVPYPSRERTLSVTGSATDSVDPDLLNIQFGVETQAATAQGAISQNTANMTNIVNAIEKIGITQDEISTSSFSIYPVYSDVPDPRTGIQTSILIGYKASNILYIKTTQLTIAGNIIDTATSAGANRVDSVTFSLSPEKQQTVEDDLLGKAVLNAQSKAGKALDPLGQKIIGVKEVVLSEFNVPPPMPLYSLAEGAPASASTTPIFQSSKDVTTTASVIFLIGDK